MMLSFSHPNIISLIGMCLDGELPLLIMPLMMNGTVLDHVKQKRETLFFIDQTNGLQVCMVIPLIISQAS